MLGAAVDEVRALRSPATCVSRSVSKILPLYVQGCHMNASHTHPAPFHHLGSGCHLSAPSAMDWRVRSIQCAPSSDCQHLRMAHSPTIYTICTALLRCPPPHRWVAVAGRHGSTEHGCQHGARLLRVAGGQCKGSAGGVQAGLRAWVCVCWCTSARSIKHAVRSGLHVVL